jgi:hypothetical protein
MPETWLKDINKLNPQDGLFDKSLWRGISSNRISNPSLFIILFILDGVKKYV